MNGPYAEAAMQNQPVDARAAITADPRDALPHLRLFLGSYFHQDWDADRGHWSEVVDDFVRESSRPAVVATAVELRRVLAAGFDEAGLRHLLESLDCALDPGGIGLDTREWLATLADRLPG